MENFENMIVFDIETTGIDPINNKIIEIGALKIKDGEISDVFHELIDPEIDIPYFITNITGITNKMVENKSKIKEVLERFIDFCDSEYIMGHNILFDYKFIKINASKYNMKFEKQGYDTLPMARKLLKHLPSKKLTALCEHYNIIHERAHRADDDAKVTYELFLKLKEEFYTENVEVFVSKQMVYKIPKKSNITLKQEKYLKDLISIHSVDIDKDISSLTKSEASRLIDNIIRKYGYVKRSV